MDTIQTYCDLLYRQLKAEAVALIIIDRDRGSVFRFSGSEEVAEKMPKILRKAAERMGQAMSISRQVAPKVADTVSQASIIPKGSA